MPLRDINTAIYSELSDTSVVIDVPVTAQVGDIATLVAVSADDVTTDLTADGWTAHGSTTPSTPAGCRMSAWTKTIAALDIGATISLEATSGRWAIALMVRYGVTGHDTTPVFTTAIVQDTTVIAPSITTSTPGTELVCVYGCQPDVAGATTTFTMPLEQTEIADICTTHESGSNATLAIGQEVLVASGASGTREATADTAIRTSAITFAFAPTSTLEYPTVQYRESGAWLEKPLKVRSGGDWV